MEHLIDVIDRDGDATISKLEFVERYAVRGAPPPSLQYKVDTPRPSIRTNWTRLSAPAR